MDNKEKKTAAEIAREERKNRIEKTSESQAAKKEKKANQSPAKKRAKIIVPVTVVVLIIAIGLSVFFGVPNRMFTAVKLADGTKISVAEYEYYYMSIYNNYVQTAMQYEQYYGSYYGEGAGKMMTGFDYTKTPANQEYTATSDEAKLDTKKYGDKPTWADYIEANTIETCSAFESFYKAAQKEKFKLTDADKKEISSYIEELRTTAKNSNYSLDAYLRANYGKGMTESLLRSILTKQTTVSNFLDTKQTDYTDAVTDKQIIEEYEKNSADYDLVSLRCFALSSTTATNTDSTKYTDDELAAMTKKDNEEKIAAANEFLTKATNENFTALATEYAPEAQKSSYKDNDAQSTVEGITSANVTSYFGEEAQKWVYDDARKVGDKTVIKTENDDGSVTCNILLMTATPTRDDSKPVSVRHILFALTKKETDETTGESKDVPLRSKEEAKKLAEDTLAAWVKSGAKEDDFTTLAADKSDDTGSSDNGGLYEDITKSSNYVVPFLNWCFEDGRKVGDYGVVETEYGYHIMYMSKISEKAQWQTDIAKALATTAFNDYYTKISEDKAYAGTLSDFFGKKVRNRVEDYAVLVIKNANEQMSTTAAAVQTTAAATTKAETAEKTTEKTTETK